MVLGVDVEPVQPPYTVSNCTFRTLDAREDWDFSEKFDFIHVRTQGPIPHEVLKKTIDAIYRNLAHGGWAEFTEWIMHLQSGDHSTDGTAFHRWNHHLRRGTIEQNSDLEFSANV
jgi:hypothetical protein